MSRFRFAENTPLVNNKKLAIPKEVQDGLDVYATYYLALAHLERNNLDQAELMFQKTLELLPEPGPNQPYYNMFRRGANANLGRINEAKKNPSRPSPTTRSAILRRNTWATCSAPASWSGAIRSGADSRRPCLPLPAPK